MLWAIRQLTVPISYLRIRHGYGVFHSKRLYDFVLPSLLSTATLMLFWLFGAKLSIFLNTELVKRLLDLLALMIAFYMAALAAVSTFERKGIDNALADNDALLYKYSIGKDIALSYRQFISYLFGFLSFLSLFLYMFLIICAFIWDDVIKRFAGHRHVFDTYVEPFFFLLTFFFIWQLVLTSMLGIYFLTERIQMLDDKK